AERHVMEELAPSERLGDMFELHDHGACVLSVAGFVAPAEPAAPLPARLAMRGRPGGATCL
ncbi:hypothetical protein NE582_15685, partial [Gordonibacter pamelaeae]|uniref:hypothetical protein n=1 Tax=Gordonibacter pamelaeae TaxID=471189 RepID=UPI00210D2082